MIHFYDHMLSDGTELISMGPIYALADYIPTTFNGSSVITGWMLRLILTKPDQSQAVIEGWGATKQEAKFNFEEVAKRWLRDTNQWQEIK